VEGDKVKGMGWFLVGWFTLFVVMCVILANIGCMPLKTADSPDSGAICMTSELYQKALDEAFNAGHEEALSETRPRADVELKLWKDTAQVQAFLDENQCDRCLSNVPGEDADDSCLDRATCLMITCRSMGYQSFLVVMNFKSNTSHAIVAFPMKDGSIVFAEPWIDLVVPTPKVGEPYINNNNIVDKIGY
jgi:hypothetical protein